MYKFDLSNSKPSQSITVVISGHKFDLSFQTSNGMLFSSVDIDDVRVITSNRVVPFGWLIPYKAYAPFGCGNFRFVCKTSDYPKFTEFNESCILVYYSEDEYNKIIS